MVIMIAITEERMGRVIKDWSIFYDLGVI